MLTEQDLEVRRGRITASTVAAFLGFHWYESPSHAWELHTGQREFEMNDDVRLGEWLEPGLVKAATTRLGWARTSYTYPCTTLVSPTHPWAAATPDVLQVGGPLIELAGIQIKNHNPHMAKTYKGTPGTVGACDNTLLPPYILAQCQWEMLVIGCRKWFLGTYFGGRDFRLYRVWRDDKMLTRLVERAHVFWRHHLDPDGPMERPSDASWNPRVGRTPDPRKLRGQQLINQPIPKSG